MALTTESPARIRARELVMLLTNAEQGDRQLDRFIAQLFRYHPFQPTGSVDDAKRIVKKYYQFGFRQNQDGTWSAYVECNSSEKQGFMWASHRSEPIALVLAALKSHIAEME